MILLCLLPLLASFGQSFACRSENGTAIVYYPSGIMQWESYGRNRRIYQRYEVKNSTITCSYVNSIGDIDYSYQDHDYEQYLIITDSNISTIRVMELDKFSTIVKLVLSQVHLQTISPGAFAGLTKLKELYLNDNELSELPNGVYNNLHGLEILNLTNNRIYTIGSSALVGVYALTELYLRNNNLSVIEDNFFETLKNLKSLDISQNPLEKFPLENLTISENLILADTGFTGLEKDISNLTLKKFDLSSNEITQVNFSHFPKVDKIDLSNNKIVSVLRLDNTLKSIEDLNLGYNLVTNFEKDFFHNLTSLQVLKLRHNRITKINPILFRDLTNLTVLDLSQNQIEEFQSGVFDNLKSLQILNISGNKLLDLHKYSFHSLSNLVSLSFDNNQISSFDVQDLKSYLPKLTTVSLDGNVWNCKKLLKMFDFLKFHKITLVAGHSNDVENLHGIACSGANLTVSSNASGISIKQISEDVEKAISDGVKKAEIDRVFNEAFEKSKFLQYFDGDYNKSNFFKYFNDFKSLITKSQDTNQSKSEKSIAMPSGEYKNTDSMFSKVMLVLIFAVLLALLAIAGLMLMFLRKNKLDYKPALSSQMEL